MPIEITLPLYIISLLASLFAEFLKMFPQVKDNEIIKTAVAIILVGIGAFITAGLKWDWNVFVSVLVFAFLNYKVIIQPVALGIGSRTQTKK